MIGRLLCLMGFHSWEWAKPMGHQKFPYAVTLRCRRCLRTESKRMGVGS